MHIFIYISISMKSAMLVIGCAILGANASDGNVIVGNSMHNLGDGNSQSGSGSTIIGNDNKFAGDDNIGIGYNNRLSGENSWVVGANQNLQGDNIRQFGPDANVQNVRGTGNNGRYDTRQYGEDYSGINQRNYPGVYAYDGGDYVGSNLRDFVYPRSYRGFYERRVGRIRDGYFPRYLPY